MILLIDNYDSFTYNIVQELGMLGADVKVVKNDEYTVEEIGNMEGRYIRLHRPPLNQQIPKEENWRQFQINKNAQTITLSELLDNIK